MKTLGIIISCIWNTCRYPTNKILSIGNPTRVEQSPTPWRVSLVVLVLGIGCFITAELMDISPLGEAARVMVYGPLGSMFGMGNQAYRKYKEGNGKK